MKSEYTEEEVKNGMDKAYEEAEDNAYFNNGFDAGIEFQSKLTRELQKSHAELLDALKAITRECCNDNSSHETIWRIADQAIKNAKP
jgi:hypothetical protein